MDAIYMDATQAMTGQGGWPMTVFATPDGHPFYTGTYFPRAQFQRLLIGISEAWRNDREGVVGQGHGCARSRARRAAARGRRRRPPTWRAGGGARSPRSSTRARRVRHGAEVPAVHGAGVPAAPRARPRPTRCGWRAGPLTAMAHGGIYDQLAGGFARYAWTPLDRAALREDALRQRPAAARSTRTGGGRTGSTALARRVALETATGCSPRCARRRAGSPRRSTRTAKARRANSTSGPRRAARRARGRGRRVGAPGVRGDRRGHVRARHLGAAAAATPPAARDRRHADPATALRARRARERVRARPRRQGGRGVERARHRRARRGRRAFRPAGPGRAAARGAAVLLDECTWPDGRLLADLARRAPGHDAGVLEDYGDVAEGLLALYGVTGETRWFRRAGELLDIVLEPFPDGKGGFYDTPTTPRRCSAPAGPDRQRHALRDHGGRGGAAHLRRAHRVGAAPGGGRVGARRGLHARREVRPVRRVGARGRPGRPGRAGRGRGGGPGGRSAYRGAAPDRAAGPTPGTVVSRATARRWGDRAPEGRTLVDGRPAAYVCRNFTCRLPATTTEELTAELARA